MFLFHLQVSQNRKQPGTNVRRPCMELEKPQEKRTNRQGDQAQGGDWAKSSGGNDDAEIRGQELKRKSEKISQLGRISKKRVPVTKDFHNLLFL